MSLFDKNDIEKRTLEFLYLVIIISFALCCVFILRMFVIDYMQLNVDFINEMTNNIITEIIGIGLLSVIFNHLLKRREKEMMVPLNAQIMKRINNNLKILHLYVQFIAFSTDMEGINISLEKLREVKNDMLDLLMIGETVLSLENKQLIIELDEEISKFIIFSENRWSTDNELWTETVETMLKSMIKVLTKTGNYYELITQEVWLEGVQNGMLLNIKFKDHPWDQKDEEISDVNT